MSVFMMSRPGASAVAGLGLAPQVQAERRYRTENKKRKRRRRGILGQFYYLPRVLPRGYTVHGAADIHPASMIPDFPA